MPSPKTYATAGAFRRALEERLKRASLTDQIDPNRLRRQVSFDRLLARGTHDSLANLVPPPADWQVPFHALAEECGLPTDVAGVFAGVQKFVEEVLAQRTER
jgi:hypothetical protein